MLTRQQRQIELHNKIHSEYEKRYGLEYSMVFHRYWNRVLLEYLPYGKNSKILELGCGTGILLQDLVHNYNYVIGIDISLNMVKKINKNFSSSLKGIVVCDGVKLPFNTEFFDIVVCRGSLHHFPSLELALSEIYRILKTGGTFVLSEPSNDAFLVRKMRKFMYKKSDKFHEEDEGYLTPELLEALKKNRFDVKATRRFGFLAYTLAGFPDHLSILRWVPFNRILTRSLLLIDELLSKIPFLRSQSLHIIMNAKKI